MTDRRPGHHNSVKKQIRDYQREHPGTSYTAAMAAIASVTAPAARATGWEPLVQPDTIAHLDALVRQHEPSLRAGENRPLRAMFTGHRGTGKTTAAHLLARKLRLEGPIVCANPNGGLGEAMDAAEGGILVLKRPDVLFAQPWDVVTRTLTELADRGTRLAVILMQYDKGDWDRGVATADHHQRAVRQSWMQSYLDTNFSERVVFPSLSAREIVDAVVTTAADAGYVLTQDAADDLDRKISELHSMRTPDGDPVLDRYGNARFARAVAETATRHVSECITTNGALDRPDRTELTSADILAGVEGTLAEPLRQTYLWIAGPQG